MALPTIILNNETALPIELAQLNLVIPGSGSINATDANAPFEILNDEELQAQLDANAVSVTFNGTALTVAQSQAFIQPITRLDILHNLTAAVAPAFTDDEDAGYSDGSFWLNTTSGTLYSCTDASAGAAVWTRLNGGGVISFGNEIIASSTTTRYMDPWYSDHVARTSLTAGPRLPIPRDGTLRNMRVQIATVSNGGETITFTLLVNGVATLLSVAIDSATASGSDTTNAVSVSAGDLIDVEVTKSAAVNPQVDEIMLSMEFL